MDEPTDAGDSPPSAPPPDEGNGETAVVDPARSRASGAPAASASHGEQVVARWISSVGKSDRPKHRRTAPAGKSSADVLRKWVEGDDSALENWIQSSETVAPPAPVAPGPFAEPPGEPSVSSDSVTMGPPSGPREGIATSPVPAGVMEREATVVRWLTDLLDRVKTEQFDPHSLVQELQEFQRQLYDERTKRKQMEEELEHVKRGSIAVIKYVRTREAKARDLALKEAELRIGELRTALEQARTAPVPTAAPPATTAERNSIGAEGNGESAEAIAEIRLREAEAHVRLEFVEREHGYVERETELRRKQIQTEEELRNVRAELELAKKRRESAGADERSLTEALQSRMNAAEIRERDLSRRESELRTKFEEIRLQTEENERRRQPLEYKEKELIAWEQELKVHKQAVDLQARKIEEAKQAGVSPESVEQMKKLSDIQAEVAKREDELRAREQFLHQRMEELEGLERKAAEAEAEKAQAEIVSDTSQKKRRSGVRRLDDLLFGGVPIGSQILVSGPAHTGKDVLARTFVTEGLKEGQAAIWVLTDKTYLTVREEATAFLPAYSEFERRGFVKYVDLYSRSLGISDHDPNVVLLSTTEKGALDQLTSRVNDFAQEFKAKGETYRIVFESISTVTAYLDTLATFRFLQPFVGRRKVDGAIGYYLIETGMHSEADIRTLEHMMDGSVNLKIDQLKNFLSVRGVTDVQSRAWVGYTFTKRVFSLGSFSLDHIR